jgi:hypothetical protein
MDKYLILIVEGELDLEPLFRYVLEDIALSKAVEAGFEHDDRISLMLFTIQALFQLLVGARQEIDTLLAGIDRINYADSDLLSKLNEVKDKVQSIAPIFFSGGKVFTKKQFRDLIVAGKKKLQEERVFHEGMFLRLREQVGTGVLRANCLAVSPSDISKANDELINRGNRFGYPVHAHKVSNWYNFRSEYLPKVASKLLESYTGSHELLFNRLDNEERQAKFIRGYLVSTMIHAFEVATGEEGSTKFDPMFISDEDLDIVLKLFYEHSGAVALAVSNLIDRFSLLFPDNIAGVRQYLKALFGQLETAAEQYRRTQDDKSIQEVRKVSTRSELFDSLLPINPLTHATGFGLTPESRSNTRDHLWVGALPMRSGEKTYLVPASSKLVWARSLLRSQSARLRSPQHTDLLQKVERGIRLWEQFQKTRSQGPAIIRAKQSEIQLLENDLETLPQLAIPESYKAPREAVLRSQRNLLVSYHSEIQKNKGLYEAIHADPEESAFALAREAHRDFVLRGLVDVHRTSRSRIARLRRSLQTDILLEPISPQKYRVKALVELNKMAGSLQRLKEIPGVILEQIMTISLGRMEGLIADLNAKKYTPYAKSPLEEGWRAIYEVRKKANAVPFDVTAKALEFIKNQVENRIEDVTRLTSLEQQHDQLSREIDALGQSINHIHPAEIVNLVEQIVLDPEAQDLLQSDQRSFFPLNSLCIAFSATNNRKLKDVVIPGFESRDQLRRFLEGMLEGDKTYTGQPSRFSVFILRLLEMLNSPLLPIEHLAGQTIDDWMSKVIKRRALARAYFNMPQLQATVSVHLLYQQSKDRRELTARLESVRTEIRKVYFDFENKERHLATGMIDAGLAIEDTNTGNLEI